MSPKVDAEELIDAREVAGMLGLSHPSAVSVYQQRYADMPRPVVDLGRGRAKLWLRPEIRRWGEGQAATGRTRPKRRVIRR
jgi:predicted DNA-binding transcriptional regulator AlpA